MRHVIVVVILAMLSACIIAAPAVEVRLKVLDEAGAPIADAEVGLGFLLAHGGHSVRTTTDGQGEASVTREAQYGVKIRVNKEGYYRSSTRTGYGDQDLVLVLREKKNPVPMYAKQIRISPVILEDEFGYDLLKGDYVSPHGSGQVADLVLKIDYDKQDAWNHEYYLTIRFSNPGDGFKPFYIEHDESSYGSDYFAPLTGYEDEWKFKRIRDRNKGLETNLDENRNYYYRVRTEVNEEGEVVSAYYGKIYGEFPGITYYFNPTPNDRNVEFETNLFKDLKHEERVHEP